MLSTPPLDADGNVEPHDHPEILDADTLIRRVNPVHHVVSDENRNCLRLSSKLMKPQGGGMSVDHERSILEEGKDPVAFVRTPVFVGAVQFQAPDARAVSLRIGYDPVEEIRIIVRFGERRRGRQIYRRAENAVEHLRLVHSNRRGRNSLDTSALAFATFLMFRTPVEPSPQSSNL